MPVYKGRRLNKIELQLLEKYKHTFADPKFKSNLPKPQNVETSVSVITPCK